MAFIWKNHLSVGNALLDGEHKKLLGLINSMEYAVKTQDSQALLRAIKQFMEGLCAHLENRNRFTPELESDQHIASHQYLMRELKHTRDELEASAGLWADYVMDHYPQFLRDWLIKHIAQEGMTMKPILQSCAYHFEPV